MNINKVILMGRLTADPELKISSNNVPVLRFTVAVNRKNIKQSDASDGRATADFIDCTAFYKTAEFISKFFKKGSLIIVFGSLQIDVWKDKNGNNQRSAKIIVDEVQFGESRKSEQSSFSRGDDNSASKEPDAYSNALDNDFFADIKDIEDELPF